MKKNKSIIRLKSFEGNSKVVKLVELKTTPIDPYSADPLDKDY